MSDRLAAATLPFRLNPSSRGALAPLLASMAEKAIGLEALNRVYEEIVHGPAHLHFTERALAVLNVSCHIAAEELENIPADGPLVVVANHPFGGLEGVILEALLRRRRADVKLLANSLLHCVPDLRDSYFFVDPFGRKDSARRNLAPLRQAIGWVQQGHALGVFPAGEVSHLRPMAGGITDGPWNDTVSRIALMTKATIVPVFFQGRNSSLFQIAGLLHPRLRTLLLPHELLRRQHSAVTVRVGRPVKPDRLASFGDLHDLTDHLRVRTYILAAVPAAGARAAAPAQVRTPSHRVPVAAARQGDQAAAEVLALPADQMLLESGPYQVGYFHARQAPGLLHEIGRQRELAFRQVGEGTGKELDLDGYDQHYLHLFAWQRERNELVGAYRMGQTDTILRSVGPRGLYTTTLFRFRAGVLEELRAALELGRSFVRPEYQCAHMPLLMLWRGIGRYVARNPQYKRLFGVVSISNNYQSVSQKLMVQFLRQNHLRTDMARNVTPRTPPRFAGPANWNPQARGLIRDVEELNELIGQIEPQMKGVPVLLRQYLKLNATMLGLNVDRKFGDVLDVLMLTDLAASDESVLARYMGKEESVAFLRHHGRSVWTGDAETKRQKQLQGCGG